MSIIKQQWGEAGIEEAGQTLLRGPGARPAPPVQPQGALPAHCEATGSCPRAPSPRPAVPFPGAAGWEVWGCQCSWPTTACMSATILLCRWPCKWTQVSAGLTEGLPRRSRPPTSAPAHPHLQQSLQSRSPHPGPASPSRAQMAAACWGTRQSHPLLWGTDQELSGTSGLGRQIPLGASGSVKPPPQGP